MADKWACFGDAVLSLPRNYQMFARMAGVRADNNTLYPAKGLPCDTAYFTSLNVFEDADVDDKKVDSSFHHHSWLNADELRQCIDSYTHAKEDVLEFKTVLSIMDYLKGCGCESRIVMWFHL